MKKKILLAIFLTCSIKSLSQVNASQKFSEAASYISQAHQLISQRGDNRSIYNLYEKALNAYVEVERHGQKRFRNKARYWIRKMNVQTKKYEMGAVVSDWSSAINSQLN